MIPLCLVMNAFGPYAGNQVIDFRELGDRKLFLIYGPTGSGKTTVLDAMCYALYGETSGRIRSGKHMRSEYAPPQESTYVHFSFAVGTKRYRIERSPEQDIAKKRGTGLKHESAKATLYAINEKDEDIAVVATKNVDTEIIRLLGFRAEQFRQVVLLPQGDFRKLLLASSSDRQQIMQMLFHTQRYAKMQALAKERHDAIQTEYSQICAQVNQYLETVEADSEEALAAHIRELKTQTGAMKKACCEAENVRNAYQKTVQDAQVLASLWQDWKRSRQELQVLQGQEKEINEKKEHIAVLEQAKLLAEPCRQIEDILKKGTEAGEREKEALCALEKARKGVIKAAESHDMLLRQQDAYKAKQSDLARLQTLVPKRQVYAELCQRESIAAGQAKEAEGAWKQADAACQELRRQLEQCRKLSQAYPETLRRYEQEKAALTQAKERLQQEKMLCELEKNMDVLQWETVQLRNVYAKASAKARADAVAYEAVQALFLQGQAAVLAASLAEGDPCPVCGATSHPRLAVRAEHMPQKEDVDRCKRQAEASEHIRQEAHVRLTAAETKQAGQKDTYEELRRQYPREGTLANWQEQVQKRMAETECLAVQEKQGKAAQEKTEALQERVKKAEEKEQILRKKHDEIRIALARLQEGKRQAEQDIPEAYRRRNALTEAIMLLENDISRYDKSREQAQQRAAAAEQEQTRAQEQVTWRQEQVAALRKEYQDRVHDLQARVQKAGFASVGACRKAQLDVPRIEIEQAAVDAYMKAVQQVQGQAEKARQDIAERPEPDMNQYKQQLGQYNEQCRLLSEQAARLDASLRQVKQIETSIAALHDRQAALTEQYKAVGSLYDLISGKTTGINFERYVLGALLDEVLLAANVRLDSMSRHRYELQRSRSWDDKRVKQIGLDIEVFDNYTGFARPANTLSGGETFLASLSLALGLADVVQAYSGGIHLDAMFIDEGFGTLDGETLDFALKALLRLKQGGRLVGIISHVPELRERMDTRLAVHKTDRGSTAAFELF